MSQQNTKESNLETTANDEYVSLEMPLSVYEKHLKFFEEEEEIRLKSAYRKTKAPKDDKVYKEKLESFIEAKNDLLEYEVEMKFKQYKK